MRWGSRNRYAGLDELDELDDKEKSLA